MLRAPITNTDIRDWAERTVDGLHIDELIDLIEIETYWLHVWLKGRLRGDLSSNELDRYADETRRAVKVRRNQEQIWDDF